MKIHPITLGFLILIGIASVGGSAYSVYKVYENEPQETTIEADIQLSTPQYNYVAVLSFDEDLNIANFKEKYTRDVSYVFNSTSLEPTSNEILSKRPTHLKTFPVDNIKRVIAYRVGEYKRIKKEKPDELEKVPEDEKQ